MNMRQKFLKLTHKLLSTYLVIPFLKSDFAFYVGSIDKPLMLLLSFLIYLWIVIRLYVVLPLPEKLNYVY